jgi:hypothetical protein
MENDWQDPLNLESQLSDAELLTRDAVANMTRSTDILH